MAHQGFGGVLDTPRSNIGDATYLSRQPDFADISQEASFLSPEKDGNFLQQLRNGGRSNGINIRTPRQRGPLADRRNLPSNIGGGEFTPLLKSATRNSIRRNGKENHAAISTTPAALRRIDEDDMTPLPRMDASIFSTRNVSYLDNDLPQVEASSAASTPMGLPPLRDADKGPLQDGNQLSLREQENVIDRIEKENFGLKLKIHFLEEALRKAGPGFSEAALKENTELKVDKVTMQRELQRYKKQITTAERDLESYRQQMLELQEKAKKKYANENQQVELDTLRQTLQDRESDIDELQRQVSQGQDHQDKVEKLQDNVEDLEAELREKDRLITEREDLLEDLKEKLDEAEAKAKDLEENAVDQDANQHEEEMEEAQATIRGLQESVNDLENKVKEMRERMNSALSQKEKAEEALDELQEEMVNKSVMTKGLSRQIEEKVSRLQEELTKSSEEYTTLEQEAAKLNQENVDLKAAMQDLHTERDDFERERQNFERQRLSLEKSLAEERTYSLEIEKDLRGQYEGEIQRLSNEISDLQAEIQAKDNLFKSNGSSSEKWEIEKQSLELKRAQAEEKAAELQRTVDHLLELEQELQGQYEEEIQRLNNEVSDLHAEIREKDSLHHDSEKWETRIKVLESERARAEEKAAGLQITVDHLRDVERDLQGQYEDEIQRLNDEVSDLQAEIREKDSLYDNDSEKWENEKKTLESERARAEERASGLQRTIDRLREAEGSLSNKETKLQEAMQSEADRHRSEEGVLNRQISDLQDALETRQGLLTKLRNELSTVRDDLRQTQIDYQAQVNKVVVLEVEVEELKLRGDDERKTSQTTTHATSQAIQELQRQLEDIEDQKLVLEEVLEEARQDAEETAAQHEHTLQRLVQKLDKAERERDAAAASHTETNKQSQRLRKSQAEVENLEHDILQQQELIDGLMASETVLRRKLERARSERAAYRMSAEKLQKDLQHLKKEAVSAQKYGHHHGHAEEALSTIVRAAEGAEARHKKELRGMVIQMEWMQARWEREASLRSDAAYAKKFLQLQLNIANACNKAQLRELEHIRTNILQSRKPLALPRPLNFTSPGGSSSPTLKSFLVMARFIARMRIAARNWAGQEVVRQKLRSAAEERRRNKRSKQLKVVPVDVF
ncbi:spindle associated [Trichoderma arundinaceum]|uniref:Spindle associated n=1 Tax=Trichoderma arundinaceum TaxID=490622 RepID=A0A395NEY4_TRIAR|nr:spindle associated [Trichoderma arundinaceum]